jgi:hypothetical protein
MTIKKLQQLRAECAKLREAESKLIAGARKALKLKYPEGYHARVLHDYLLLGRGTPEEVLTLAKEGAKVV